jgi:hypothetical protein
LSPEGISPLFQKLGEMRTRCVQQLGYLPSGKLVVCIGDRDGPTLCQIRKKVQQRAGCGLGKRNRRYALSFDLQTHRG